MERGRFCTVVIASALTLAACGSGDSSEETASTGTASGAITTEAPAAETTEAPTTDAPSADTTTAATTAETVDDDASGGDIVGQWATDAGDVLRIATAPFGGTPPDCSGPYVITFGADGSYTGDIDLSCAIGGADARGEVGVTARYTADGVNLQISDAVVEGNVNVNGVAVPLPLDGFTEPFGRPATYTIEGDTLTLDFTTADGIPYTFQFTRLA